mgnify:CR=1 FL=1
MINVIVGTNTEKQTIIAEPSRTLRSLLEEAEVDYATGAVHLDGSTIKPGDLDKTFADLGIKDKCYLISVVKSDSGK